MPLSWLALLFVVLAAAVTALDEDNPLLRDLGRESSAAANIKKLAAKYRSAAMQCLAADQFLYQHNLHTVQALVLLVYAMNHANVSSWALLGMTWSIAVKIGCHIDPSRLGLTGVEAEERRRAWAALMMLYTVQNTCLGNSAPQAVAANVDLPADKDDDKINAGTPTDYEPTDISRGPSKMSYILYKFRLYSIAAEICRYALDQQLSDPQILYALDQKLANEETEHSSRFSDQHLPLYHIAHHYILQSYTHHLHLILHRASLNAHSATDASTLQSQQRCKTSAITILEVHARLYEQAEFRPYRWYVYGLGSFQAFLAIAVLIILSASPALLSEEDRVHTQTIVEQSVQRFESMAGRSDVCARAAVILHRVLQSNAQSPAVEYHRDTGGTAVLQKNSEYQFPTSPVSNAEYTATEAYAWNANPELEALLFDMAPQQWMAPTSFTWDRWDATVFV